MNDKNQSPQHDNVEITINGATYPIQKGTHSIASLKQLGNVPAADELAELKNKKLHPLSDDGQTNINGKETFVSHPRDSGSSNS
jgi:hypothetical protein